MGKCGTGPGLKQHVIASTSFFSLVQCGINFCPTVLFVCLPLDDVVGDVWLDL